MIGKYPAHPGNNTHIFLIVVFRIKRDEGSHLVRYGPTGCSHDPDQAHSYEESNKLHMLARYGYRQS